jgi:hypothetical protein
MLLCSGTYRSSKCWKVPRIWNVAYCLQWAGWRSRYSNWLRAGRSRDRIPVGARFSAPVQTGPGAHPASCTMGIVSFPGVKSGRVVTLTPHPLLVPWSWKSRAVPLLPLWAVRPVQSLSACTRVYCTFTYCLQLYGRRMRRPCLTRVHGVASESRVMCAYSDFFKRRVDIKSSKC